MLGIPRLGFALRYVQGSRDSARAWFRKAREIVRAHGLCFVEATIAIYWGWAEEVFGEIADIQRELTIAETHRNASSRFEAAFRQIGVAFVLARQNELGGAVSHLRECHSFMQQSGYTLGQLSACGGLVGTRLSSSDFNGARDTLDQMLSLWFPGELRSYMDGMFGAAIALGMQDEERARSKLQRALQLGAKHRLENTLSEHIFRRTIVSLCTFALKLGIEPEYVKRVIHAQHLPAPSPEVEDWPWPVRIRAFGTFSLEIEDRPISFPGKVPKKPLELLKALVSGGGGNADIRWLGEQLWPDAEGDAVRDAFNVTLSRLRKLLPVDGVLLLGDGQLRLNPALVWCDVWAFERVAEECLGKLRQRAESPEIESACETLLSLYSGDLLKGEPDTPWLVSARDRCRSRSLRTLKSLGHLWEAQEAWEKAQSLYERVLEFDNVAEDVYRRLMDCYARADQPAEALRVYLRCRQMLSVVLGIAPSAETEALCRSIRQAKDQ